MITDLVVYGSLGLTAAFVLAWAIRPDLREWIERPKYRFLEDVKRFDGK